MYSNLFSVRIPEGKEVSDQYVEMVHGTTYSIIMRNDRHVDCDAVVTIDGQHVGTWRINSNSNIRIERPADKPRLFTFYKLGSSESSQAGIANDDSLGLVSVEFKPAKAPAYISKGARSSSIERNPYIQGEHEKSFGGLSRSAGGTGLSGSSNQSFGSAAPIDHDLAEAYTIHLRLVAVEAAPAIEPLTPRSTPIPKRIG